MDEVPSKDKEDLEEAYSEGPQAPLELAYLEAYLQTKGYRLKDLCKLPEGEARQLMIEACRYASARLSEVEARARFQREIHGITQPP